ncbi:unnamed protein product, partial [Symbiodinium microadriaticum]
MLDVVKYLVEKGADAAAVDHDNRTIVHSACESGSVDLVEYLTEQEVEIDQEDNNGITPFLVACHNGALPVCETLLSRGCNVYQKGGMENKGDCALHFASRSGQLHIVKWLDFEREDGSTLLHSAAAAGNAILLETLVSGGCDVEKRIGADGNVTALHVACHGQHLAIVCYLVRSGIVDVAERDDEGLTAADVARRCGMSILSDWLDEIARGCDIDTLSDPIETYYNSKQTVQEKAAGRLVSPQWPSTITDTDVSLMSDDLSQSVGRSEPSMFSCLTTSASISTLVEFPSSHSDYRHETEAPAETSTYSNDEVMLHKSFIEAIENGDIAMANSLFVAGASPLFATPTSLNTALHTACVKGDIIGVKYLCDRGADVNACNLGGLTPLHVAADRELTEIALHLIREGAMLGIVNKAGQSALHIMASRGMTNAIRELATLPSKLLRTHDINTKTASNQTVLHLAVAAGHSELLEDLLRLDVAVDATDNDGQTSLHLACALSNYQACMLLLAKGADPNKFDDEGKSALYFACVSGNIKLVQALVDHSGIIQIRTRKQTPAMYALDSSDPAMVEWIKGK